MDTCTAPHLFCSVVGGLQKAILTFDAQVVTAIQIAVRWKSEDEGLDADVFLVFVAGPDGMERLLLVAMYSDGAGEVMVFLRCWDTERHDPARLVVRIKFMLNKLDTLFNQRRCLELGFTKFMLASLRNTRSYSTRAGPMTCGCHSGVDGHIIEACIARMCSWLVLVVAVIKA